MDLTLSIINELARIFPDGTFYREQIEQGFTEPSFYVYPISATQDPLLTTRNYRKRLYCVTWFPDTSLDTTFEQLEIMSDKLMNEFKFLTDERLHILSKDLKVQDGVLILTFGIRYVVQEVAGEFIKMQGLTEKGELKNG
ncbi:phage tail terminator family protein [Aerococcus urinaeequi]|uniref:phage tail terminator family protein n=1 Tax=Aerococcus urinaeequi TaxID=51665 RepID=UPI003D6C12C0